MNQFKLHELKISNLKAQAALVHAQWKDAHGALRDKRHTLRDMKDQGNVDTTEVKAELDALYDYREELSDLHDDLYKQLNKLKKEG